MSKKAERARKADQLWRRGSAAEDRGQIGEAIRLYRAGAKLGDASAQLNLGNLLDDYAKPRRPEEAIYWYKRAIRAGNYTAAYNLAIHYRNNGQSRWHLYWLRVASKMGDPDAPNEARALERQLQGAKERDRVRVLQMLERASANR
jgi:TPR repeat protein